MRGAMYAFGTHERSPSRNASGFDELTLRFAAVHSGPRPDPRSPAANVSSNPASAGLGVYSSFDALQMRDGHLVEACHAG